MACRHMIQKFGGIVSAGTFLRMALDQLVWAPIFLSTIVAAQFTLEVAAIFLDP